MILLFQTSTHIRVLHEAIRSTVIISDLFMDKSQFTWMMNIFLDLSKMHTVEDELLHQYLIVGICKAVSILNPVSLRKPIFVTIVIDKSFFFFRNSKFMTKSERCWHNIWRVRICLPGWLVYMGYFIFLKAVN